MSNGQRTDQHEEKKKLWLASAASLSGDQEQSVSQIYLRQLVWIPLEVDCNVDGRHKKYREFLECIEGSFLM